MNQLEVRHLLLVAAVADDGSLTRAGMRLNLTQSALSHQLLSIEERLGTALFHRINRRMVLTAAGERVLASARRVLDDLARTEEDVRQLASHRAGTIRLTTECYTCYHWLPALMKRFGTHFPQIDIQVDVDATDHATEALLAGTIDLALVIAERAPRGIALQPLFDDELLVLAAPDHPLAAQDFVKTIDFAGETLLTYMPLRDTFVYQRLLRPNNVEPRRHMQLRLTEGIVEMVRAGVGIAVMSRWATSPYLDSGAIVGLRLTRRGFARRWKAAHLSARPLPSYLSAFIRLVGDEAPHTKPRAVPVGVPVAVTADAGAAPARKLATR
jgi:LysR family transcriptional regulator for metE and metH